MINRLLVLALWLMVPVEATAQWTSPEPVPIERDDWSRKVTWRSDTAGYGAAVHASLLPSGEIVFVGYQRPVPDTDWTGATESFVWTMLPTPLGQQVPAEMTGVNEAVPYDAQDLVIGNLYLDDDLFCSGQTLTADGKVFTAGGTRLVFDIQSGEYFVIGLPYATEFDGSRWTRVAADMNGAGVLEEAYRWYPSCTRMPDGRILTVSGYEIVYPEPTPNISVEAYDPALGDWTVLSPAGATPHEIFNSDYTHPFVLPDPVGPFDVLMFGEAGLPVLFSSSGGWFVKPRPRPGTQAGQVPNHGASSALLPIRVHNGEWGYYNGATMVAGGMSGTSHQRSADIYDPVTDAWIHRADLRARRHHPASVVLPDGKVLLVGGHSKLGGAGTRHATYLDPASGFGISTGRVDSGVTRGYHTVALLLPDGRVLVGGGQDEITGASLEKTHFQYYSPPYLSRPRPTIVDAPETLGYGGLFTLTTDSAAATELVLVSLGSMTHSIDTNQRHVQLPILFDSGDTVVSVGPADPATAPPGFYMLFALDADRTPSEARMVRVQ